MSKQDLLSTLKRSLKGKVSEQELSENLAYYEEYIGQETASGRSEEEVLEELGDPRILAKTIVATAGGRRRIERNDSYDSSGNPAGSTSGSGQKKSRFSWAYVIIGIVFVLLVFSFFFGGVSIIFRALMAIRYIFFIIILAGIIYLFFRTRRR